MNGVNKKESANKEKLIPLTARHHESSYNAISELAEEFKVGKAVVVRMSTAGHLEKYLGQVRFIDEDEGRTINENIVGIGNLISEMRNDLRRIGINYNQEIKIRNVAKKIALENEAYKKQERYADLDTKMEHFNKIENLEKEIELLRMSSTDLTEETLENFMEKYEQISESICNALSPFLS